MTQSRSVKWRGQPYLPYKSSIQLVVCRNHGSTCFRFSRWLDDVGSIPSAFRWFLTVLVWSSKCAYWKQLGLWRHQALRRSGIWNKVQVPTLREQKKALISLKLLSFPSLPSSNNNPIVFTFIRIEVQLLLLEALRYQDWLGLASVR